MVASILEKITALYNSKKSLFQSSFPNIFSSDEEWDNNAKLWLKTYESFNPPAVVPHQRRSLASKNSSTYTVAQEKYEVFQRFVELFLEKLNYFVTSKGEVSVFLSSKYSNDVYSVFYAIQLMIEPKKTKELLYSELKPEARTLWEMVIDDKKKRKMELIERQEQLIKGYKGDVAEADLIVKISDDDDLSCDWYHFSLFLESYLKENKTEMTKHMNPFIHVEQVDFEFDVLYILLLRFFLFSHSFNGLQNNAMPITVDNIAALKLPQFLIFECEFELIHLRDIVAFTRKYDMLKAIADIILTEGKEFESTRKNIDAFIKHLNNFSLELCYVQKILLWIEFRKLFFFTNKQLSSIVGETREKNIVRTNSLRKAAKKYNFDPLWLASITSLHYERHLIQMFKMKNIKYKAFSFDSKVVQEILGSENQKSEEFPAMLLTNNYFSCEPGLLIFGKDSLYFISFLHNKDARTHVAIPYVHILSLDVFESSTYTPANIVVMKKDGEHLHFFSVINIRETTKMAIQHSKDAEKVVEVQGESIIIKEGYLSKQGNSYKSWYNRYFILYMDKLIYKTDASGKEIDCIQLKNVMKIEKDTFDKDSNIFYIISATGKHIMKAQTKMEQNQWIAALQTTLHRQDLLFPFVHISVCKKNTRGKVQSRVLQFDFLNKRINNLNGNTVRKMHPFTNIESTKIDSKDKCHIVINFRKQTKSEYDIYTMTPEYTKLISQLCSLISKKESITIKEIYANILNLFEKSSFVFERTKKNSSLFSRSGDVLCKRWIILQAGQIVVYNEACDVYPVYCLSLHDCTVSNVQTGNNEMLVSMKTGSLKRFEFSSVQERDEWVKLCRRYSIERTNDEFFVERETIVVRRESSGSLTSASDSKLLLRTPSEQLPDRLSLNISSSRFSMPNLSTAKDTNGRFGDINFVALQKERNFESIITTQSSNNKHIYHGQEKDGLANDESDSDDEEDEEDDEDGEIIINDIAGYNESGALLTETSQKFEKLQSLHKVRRLKTNGDIEEREIRLTIDLTAIEWKRTDAVLFDKILLVDIIDIYEGMPKRLDNKEMEKLPHVFTIATYNALECISCDNVYIRDLYIEILGQLSLY